MKCTILSGNSNHFQEILKVKYFGEPQVVDDGIVVIKGEIYSHTTDEVINILRNERYEDLRRVIGEFFVIYFNTQRRKIYFCNDRAGRELLFYYFGKEVVLGDDFWSIAKILNITLSDLDPQNIKELLLFFAPLDNHTIIKNLNILPPASFGVINLDTAETSVAQYWNFRFNIDSSRSFEESIEEFDFQLTEAFGTIKKYNKDNCKYGVGISGGLDSRILPFYAEKNDMSLESFIIGERNSKFGFVSNDHINAKKIAETYGLEHKEIPFAGMSYNERSDLDIINFPYGVSQIFKAIPRGSLKCDVLLTGASGFLVGSTIPTEIENYSNDQMFDIIIRGFSFLRIFQKSSKIRKAIGIMINHQKQNTFDLYLEGIDGVVSEKELNTSFEKIRNFLLKLDGYTNLEKYFNYYNTMGGNLNKYGAFESILREKKTYTPYYPFLFDFELTWPPEYFNNRNLLKGLISSKISKLSEIRAQDYKVSISKARNSTIYDRTIPILSYYLRGDGVSNYKKWLESEAFQVFETEVLRKKNGLFDACFDIIKIKKLHEAKIIDERIWENIIKIKRLLDIIEDKQYYTFH